MMRWHLVALAGAALLAGGLAPAKASPLGSMYASQAVKAQSDVVLVHRSKRRHYNRRHHRRYGLYYGPRYYYPYYGRYYYSRPYYPRRYYRRHYRRPGVSLYFRF